MEIHSRRIMGKHFDGLVTLVKHHIEHDEVIKEWEDFLLSLNKEKEVSHEW